MDCVLEWVPTSSLWYEKKTPSGMLGTAMTLRKNGVLCHDILGKRSSCDKSYLPRFCFLLPGRLVYSRNLRGADEALAEAIYDADRGTRTLDLTPNLQIEYINSVSFRVWNPSDWTAAEVSKNLLRATPPTDDVVAPTPSGSGVQFSNVTTGQGEASSGEASPSILQIPFGSSSASNEPDRVLSSLTSSEEKQSLSLLFKSPEQAKTWEAALLAEKDKVYMPEVAAIPSFGRQAQFAVWRSILSNTSGSLMLRRLCFDHETSSVLQHLHMLFALGVPEHQMLEGVDSFAAFLSVVARNLPVLLILLGFKLPDDLLYQFINDKKSLNNGSGRAVSTGSSSEALDLVELVAFIAKATNDEAWAPNRKALPWLFGFPEKMGIYGVRKWFSKISNARGKFAHPFKISWAQLKLLLQPTPFLGFFFVDHYVNVGDVKRARAVCAGLPYDMTASFPAIYRSPEVEVKAAHFVHYLEWDSLQRSYEEFEADNEHNDKLHEIVTVVRAVYNAPLASAAHWAALAYVSEREVLEDCIAQLLDGMEHETVPELVVVREICARWMQHTLKTAGSCKAPKKSHILTVLTVAAWAQNMGCLPGHKTQSKAICPMVGPSEDRALLTGLLALYLTKGLGKHVHILCSSNQSLFRDCNRMTPFFASMDVTASMNDFSQAADVTYCLQRDLTQFYRDSVFFGHVPLGNTILLVDDMDDLDIDKNPNSIYGKRDEELTSPLKTYFDEFLSKGDAAEADPPAVTLVKDSLGAVSWAKAKAAYAQYRTMVENAPNGYARVGTRLELLDAKGKVVAHKYSGGLEMARYKIDGEVPSISSKFFYQSLPHLFGQYEGIVGLGSRLVGTDVSENKRFLEKFYGCWSFNVPAEKQGAAALSKEMMGTLSVVDETVVGTRAEGASQVGAGAADRTALLSGDALGKLGLAGDGTTSSAAGPGVAGNGLDSRWQTPPRTPDEKYEAASAVSASAVYSTHYASLPNLPDIIKGQMMNELCDRFYLKFPHDDGRWPSRPEHRRLTAFLDDEAMHGPRAIADFAAAVGLARSSTAYKSSYDP